MNRKHNIQQVPKIGFRVSVAIIIVLILVGIYREMSGESCGGFLGTSASCVEETLFWSYGIIVLPIAFIFGIWRVADYMEKPIKLQVTKKTKSKK